MATDEEWFRDAEPGVRSDSSSDRTPDQERLDRQASVIEHQLGAVRELKAEAREAVKLQTAVLGAFIGGLSLIETQLTPGRFVSPQGAVELVGLTALLASATAFLSVFLLVPRPLVDREPVLTVLPRIRPTREFRFPDPSADASVCIRFNEEVIDRTEWRLQRLQRLNVIGILAFLLWVATQLLA